MNPGHFFHQLLESYVFILLLALVAGIFFSNQTALLSPYSTLFLAAIFFLSALKIDLGEFFGYMKDYRMVLVANLFMLIALPIAIYFLTLSVFPALAVAFLLLAAMPCGMTTPLLAEISGGRQSLALVLAISSSLLAPFTVPLVVKLLAGTAVEVGFLPMFLSLAKVIFIPFILANIVKYLWHHKIKATYFTFKPISIILLGLLIAGIVSKQSGSIISGLSGEFLIYIGALFILFIIFHILGYYAVYWKPRKDRITITVCLTYLNFTLAIYLADKFFDSPNIAIPVILSVLPWSILIIPFKYFASKK